MTPAINIAKKLKLNYLVHEYEHDASSPSYGLEAAQKLGVSESQVFKTLVVKDNNDALAVAILPVNCTLNVKKMAKALGCKKVKMADPAVVERVTGYVLGGVSPLGQKKRLATVIDTSAKDLATIYISGGKRGLEIELPAIQLAKALTAKFVDVTEVPDANL